MTTPPERTSAETLPTDPRPSAARRANLLPARRGEGWPVTVTGRPRRASRKRSCTPPDRVPELTHYRDEGCRVWPACLTCPLPRCVEEEPSPRRGLHRSRNESIVRLHEAGWSGARLAAHYHMSERHIFRIIRHVRHAGRQPRSSPASDHAEP